MFNYAAFVSILTICPLLLPFLQCEGELVCFKRHGRETVPGCSGRGKKGKDYCIDPHSLKSSQSEIPTEEHDSTLVYDGDGKDRMFDLCHGECDNDSQVSAFVYRAMIRFGLQ